MRDAGADVILRPDAEGWYQTESDATASVASLAGRMMLGGTALQCAAGAACTVDFGVTANQL